MEQCDKHDDCITRINESIHRIELANNNTQGQMTGFVNMVNEFLLAIRKDVYAKDGIMQRVGTQGNQLVLQWALIIIILGGIVGTAVTMAWKR